MKKLTPKQAFNLMSVVILSIAAGLFITLIAYAQEVNPKDTEYIGMLIICASISGILLFVQMIATLRSFMYGNN